ncbi:MAG: HAMP domain-containing histidine kinase [Prevotella sp.]|nr:HAMP domain-containing histidine kinase [Staphylococcus sp.]MCM1351057.1 HAMP domain-containing histidine kinase [Prevotella sp.]
MKKNRFNQQFQFSLIGFMLFCLDIGVTACVVIVIYNILKFFHIQSYLIFAIMVIVVILLALVCSIIDMIRRKKTIEKPLYQILEATKQITFGNYAIELQPRHSIARYDAFDWIMENLNQMARALSDTEMLKSDFISSVSHEIKTPLAIIQNYAIALSKTDISEEQRQKSVKILVDTTNRLTHLVMNILQLNKLEHQTILPQKTIVFVNQILENAILQFEKEIEKKQLQLSCHFEDIRLKTVDSYLEMILNNLISNAVKFTGEKGSITLCLYAQCNQMIFSIADNGCGMSPTTGSHIFEKFYQGDTSHKQEGNGLGLSLVKKAVDYLEGEIEVESILNQGTTFTVKLGGIIDE